MFRLTLLAAFGGLLLTGCQTSQIVVPERLAEHQPLAVAHHTDGSVSVGAYTTSDFWTVRADAPHAYGSAVTPAGAERYGFTLRLHDAALWEADCTTDARTDSSADPLVACTLTSAATDASWTLMLRQSKHGRAGGLLQRGTEIYEVRDTHHNGGGFDTRARTGFYFAQMGQIMGAIALGAQPEAWIQPSSDAEQASLLAMLSATLVVTDLRA
jgi:hypothetical protein